MSFLRLTAVIFLGCTVCSCVGTRYEYMDHLKDDSSDTQLKWNELMEVSKTPGIKRLSDPVRDLLRVLSKGSSYRYYGGVYGKRGNMVIYAINKRNLQHRYHFYWKMVRVLSEKYGCFMKSKMVQGNRTDFKCRDGRKVSFKTLEGKRWRMFSGRQYDSFGNEIIIHKRGKLVAKLDSRL